MGQCKFTLYKDIKIGRGWQKAKAAFYSNGKIKPNVIIYKGKEQEHPEGGYYVNDRGKWIFAGKDALDAQRFRAQLLDRHELARLKGEPQPAPVPAVTKGTPLMEAMDLWLANLEAQGRDVKTLRPYRAAVAPFVAHCKVKTVEECQNNKQVMFDYMAWLRKQPKTKRLNANPERTYANKVGHVACFLSHFGVKTGLKKAEYPQYEEKTVTAHTDEELDYLYSRADKDRGFFLDFGLNSGFRDMELAHAEDTDLVGLLLEVKRKPHLVSTDYPNGFHPKKWHCRKVKVTPAFAARWRERAKKLGGGLMLRAPEGGIETHLNDRWLQPLAEGATFQTETHKLRKTWATRLALKGVPLPMLQKMLGHKSLAYTQRYLADVDLTTPALDKQIEAAVYVPKPKIVKSSCKVKC